jgi:rare lipoprotein A
MRLPAHWQACGADCLFAMLLVGCGSVPKATSTTPNPSASAPATASRNPSRDLPVLPPAGSGRGGYYQDDGPGDNPPAGLMDVPDAEPKIEPIIERSNRPYNVFGKTYTPITDNRPFKQRGVGSWYGKKFHGQKTSSGELYDMYKITAAHPTLPIPSYARVTNLNTGAQIIVRINDRGPFHSSRIIDLSYTAALKLGYLGKGSNQLEVERLLPDEIARIASGKSKKPDVPVTLGAPPKQEVRQEAQQEAKAPLVSIDDAVMRSDQTTPSIVETAAIALPVVLAATPSLSLENPVTPAQADAAPTSVPVAAGGFYLQLGAYAQAANAQAICTQLKQKWSVNLPPIEVVETGTLYRLYSGPFATRADAVQAAQQVQDSGLSKPLIVQR